jgi:chromosomal replication initiation ATPase DnaA
MRARALQQLWLFGPARRFATPTVVNDHVRDVVDIVVVTVTGHFGASIHDVRGTTRRQPVAQIRMVAMYVARKVTKLGPVAIAAVLKRDHSTVVHGVQQIESALVFDPFLRRNVAACLEKAATAVEQLTLPKPSQP